MKQITQILYLDPTTLYIKIIHIYTNININIFIIYYIIIIIIYYNIKQMRQIFYLDPTTSVMFIETLKCIKIHSLIVIK